MQDYRDPALPLRVVIDARVISGSVGGVEQFVIGFANGLSSLDDGKEEYLFLAILEQDEWLRPYVQGACRMIYSAGATREPEWAGSVRNVPGVGLLKRLVRPLVGRWMRSLPRSDGTVEREGVNVMHFPTQNAFVTGVPSIYQPWDLQHRHLPEFFSKQDYRRREFQYRSFCRQAEMVAVASSWNKRDLVEQYNLPAEKVQVVPAAPVLSAYSEPTAEDLAAVRAKYPLPDRFVFYPAQTWAHKNHLKLLEALAILRDRDGLIVPLVSSGKKNEFYGQIEGRARQLNLSGQAYFLGFVTPVELQSLYRLCQCLVFPSKFEGWGMPLTEAFMAGVPVACSNVTSLPDLAGDAALIFNPDNADEIAGAIKQLWTDDELCRELIGRGAKRVGLFSWDHTARLFRAHYRRIAGRHLTDEDRALLAAPPLI